LPTLFFLGLFHWRWGFWVGIWVIKKNLPQLYPSITTHVVVDLVTVGALVVGRVGDLASVHPIVCLGEIVWGSRCGAGPGGISFAMEDAVTKQRAYPNTVFHCLYGFYNFGYSKQEQAQVYNTTDKTIGNWIKVYKRAGIFERARTKVNKKFSATHRQWLIDCYQARPLAYIDEAQSAFKRAHNIDISKTSVWRIIHDGG